MPSRVIRLALTVLLGAVLLSGLSVLATAPAQAQAEPLAAAQTVQPAPPGPTIEPQAPEGDNKRKLVIGVTAAVLLGIVVWGNRVRWKRRKKG